MDGFIYVLKNETMPGILKIGKTSRIPRDRSKELFTTGVAVPFEIAFAIYVNEVDEFEKSLHEELAEHRVSSNREFFRVAEDEVIQQILNCFLTFAERDSLEVARREFVIDSVDADFLSMRGGFNDRDIMHLLWEFTEDEWRAAHRRYQQRLHEREKRDHEEEIVEISPSENGGHPGWPLERSPAQ